MASPKASKLQFVNMQVITSGPYEGPTSWNQKRLHVATSCGEIEQKTLCLQNITKCWIAASQRRLNARARLRNASSSYYCYLLLVCGTQKSIVTSLGVGCVCVPILFIFA